MNEGKDDPTALSATTAPTKRKMHFPDRRFRHAYVGQYYGADAGKMAHYMMRRRMRDGSTSAWGETASATITG